MVVGFRPGQSRATGGTGMARPGAWRSHAHLRYVWLVGRLVASPGNNRLAPVPCLCARLWPGRQRPFTSPAAGSGPGRALGLLESVWLAACSRMATGVPLR